MSAVHNILIHSSSQPSHNLQRSFNNVKGNSIFWRGKNAIQIGNKRDLTSSSNNVSIDPTNNTAAGKIERGNETKEVIEAEEKSIVKTYKKKPIVIEWGKRCKIYGVEGNEYLDMAAGVGAMAIGHTDDDWLKALIEQASKIAHTGNIVHTKPQVELADRLKACSFADYIFFSNSGTEANEAAIKFVRKYHRHICTDGKQPATEFIAFTNGFHGRTMGSLALTSKEEYKESFGPLMPGATILEYENVRAAEDLIHQGKIAAVFLEPIQGEGGIHPANKEFLTSLRRACDETGTLLVFDEIQCGLGRTGFLWAHEAYGVFPDIMTLAKALGGGLAIGATLVTKKIASAINVGDHGSTFGGNPLATNSALTVLDKVSKPDFLASVAIKGFNFKELLKQKLGGNRHVREIRGVGLMIGIELDVPASPLVDACLDSGLLVLTAGNGYVVRLVPPLIITEQELEFAAEILHQNLPVLDKNN